MTVRLIDSVIAAKDAGLMTADNGIKKATWTHILQKYNTGLPSTCASIDSRQCQNKVNYMKKKYAIFMVSCSLLAPFPLLSDHLCLPATEEQLRFRLVLRS